MSLGFIPAKKPRIPSVLQISFIDDHIELKENCQLNIEIK